MRNSFARNFAAWLFWFGILAASSVAHAGTCKNPRMLIVLDKSSSMMVGTIDGQDGSPFKWNAAKDTLATITKQYEATIDFGLMVFPEPNKCSTGVVKVKPATNMADEILAELATPPPTAGNYTPMFQSLDAVLQETTMQDLSVDNYVLLLTDGWQWCDPYDSNTRFMPVDSVTKLKGANIITYVVGIGSEVDVLTLNKMAEAALTKSSPTCDVTQTKWDATDNCYYQATNVTSLSDVLKQIANIITTEKCDGKDNDCDGKIDENLIRPCSTICGQGTTTCVNGVWGDCTARSPSTEICDGIDNNCDGTVDEGCTCTEGESRVCGSNVGVCKEGSQTCLDGKWTSCHTTSSPSPEDCDGLDNDCDGKVDEPDQGSGDLTKSCDTACGQGIQTCANKQWSECSAHQPTAEICDGVDNDCDQMIDGPDTLCPNNGECKNGLCAAPTEGTPGQLGKEHTLQGSSCAYSQVGNFFPMILIGGLLFLLGLGLRYFNSCQTRRSSK